ncbi:MAG: MBL fold metallo-hydrolase [Deltaproteobacteria bacterium]|nr:MAG: MBL fold metallo-hydrolase [Deltaproteobacteria bacterium]
MIKLCTILAVLFSFTANVWGVDFIYKPASRMEIAVDLQKIEGGHLERFVKPYEIQRLSKNVYAVSTSLYIVTVVVGHHSVLLIDAPLGRGKNILQAIEKITSKPIRALVYSHSHKDHIGDAAVILKDNKHKIDILSTGEVYDEIIANKIKVLLPTKIVGHIIYFEGIKIKIGQNLNGHTVDNTSFVIRDGHRKILHVIDLVYADQLPFQAFALAHNVIKYQTDLKTLMELEWDVMVPGHGNLAYKADIKIMQDYIADTKAFVGIGFSQIKFEDFVKPGSPYVWFINYKDAIVDVAFKLLASKYREGNEEEFDALAKSHLEAIFWTMITR